MYSQSSAYPQYPQQTGFQQNGGQGQQGFQLQPTGYQGPQSGFQPQQTGFASQQPGVQQSGGFGPQQYQAQPTGFQPSSAGFQQQQSAFNTRAQPQQSQQSTGQTFQNPAQMQKGASNGQQTPFGPSVKASPQATGQTRSVKLPNVRLSFLVATDQSKFEQLFKSAIRGNGQALPGEEAKVILQRSNLPPQLLTKIWLLSDTTKSGALLFPEFALAMYLCNLALSGKGLPDKLPERVANEVSSVVDIISFGVAEGEQTPTSSVPSHVPNFGAPKSSGSRASAQSTSQPSNTQILGQLASQPSGRPLNLSTQSPISLTPQMTAMPAGSQYSRPSIGQSQSGPGMPLSSQPTGRPGQWGFVNAPSSGLPGIQQLQQRMMPQIGREGAFSTQGLQGNATIPWAVTKDEKQIYDGIFKAWDGMGRGFVDGGTAIEIFGQSGLPQPELERIWTLADPSNRGKLDIDEFAVAMHLVYRRLNNYDLPTQLPPELVPPSSRRFEESVNQVKSFLKSDSDTRRSSGAILLPQHTGVSYMKNRSFRETPQQPNKKDATVYKFDDSEVGYTSSARRRSREGDSARSSPKPTSQDKEVSMDQLRKSIREQQILLDAVDSQDSRDAENETRYDRRDRDEADELYRRIRRLQTEIDEHADSDGRTKDNSAEQRTLLRQVQNLADKLPPLTQKVHRTDSAIADARLELFRLRDAKEHPSSASSIKGTGPSGEVTESDRRKARSAALLQSRMAALTGKPAPESVVDDSEGSERRLVAEKERIRQDKEKQATSINDIETSIHEMLSTIEDTVRVPSDSVYAEDEKRRWEEGIGVEEEVKDFIFDLQRASRTAARRKPSLNKPGTKVSKANDTPVAARQGTLNNESPGGTISEASPSPRETNAAPPGEDRAAYIKREAERRMNERLAALGLKPSSHAVSYEPPSLEELPTAPSSQKVTISSPPTVANSDSNGLKTSSTQGSKRTAKPPPPPPSRDLVHEQEQKRQNDEILEQEQARQEKERMELEDEMRKEEMKLKEEQNAQEDRITRLREQQEGKKKAADEKKKQDAGREISEREQRLQTMRMEIEKSREEERMLQEVIDNGFEDENAKSYTSADVEANRETAISPARGNIGQMSETNPFFRLGGQPNGASQSNTSIASPASESNNPFYRLVGQSAAAPQQPVSLPTTEVPRHKRNDSDDWSIKKSEPSENGDEEAPEGTGRTPAELASMLFGSMGTPRSHTSIDRGTPMVASPAISPGPQIPAFATGPDAPMAPPPPPPPFSPASSPDSVYTTPPPGPRPPAMQPPQILNGGLGGDRGGLLEQIQLGKTLKKTQTKDKATPASAGRVLS